MVKFLPALKTSIHHAPTTNPKPALKVKSTKMTSPTSTAMVQNIVALKQAFLDSFDTLENISRTYTIRTDPSGTPAPYAWRKVPIKHWEQIEYTADDMVSKGVIAPVSQPTEWVSSLTYPHKLDSTLHICLNPKDLNKAIVWEHYKAPTLDEIPFHLSEATCFSKLDA